MPVKPPTRRPPAANPPPSIFRSGHRLPDRLPCCGRDRRRVQGPDHTRARAGRITAVWSTLRGVTLPPAFARRSLKCAPRPCLHRPAPPRTSSRSAPCSAPPASRATRWTRCGASSSASASCPPSSPTTCAPACPRRRASPRTWRRCAGDCRAPGLMLPCSVHSGAPTPPAVQPPDAAVSWRKRAGVGARRRLPPPLQPRPAIARPPLGRHMRVRMHARKAPPSSPPSVRPTQDMAKAEADLVSVFNNTDEFQKLERAPRDAAAADPITWASFREFLAERKFALVGQRGAGRRGGGGAWGDPPGGDAHRKVQPSSAGHASAIDDAILIMAGAPLVRPRRSRVAAPIDPPAQPARPTRANPPNPARPRPRSGCLAPPPPGSCWTSPSTPRTCTHPR
jgi:hypothetical protein